CALSISSDSVNRTAEFCKLHQNSNENNDDNRYDNRRINISRNKRPVPVGRSDRKRDLELCPGEECLICNRDHVRADYRCHTTSEEHSGQCDDKWLDLKI